MLLRKINSLLFRFFPFMALLALLLLLSGKSRADCVGILGQEVTSYDMQAASLGVGRINIMSNYLQPVGTVLATGMSNYDTIRQGGLARVSAEGIVVTCDKESDKDSLAWAFATNGDSRIGGFYEIPNFPGYYATQFPYVAVKLSFADTGEVFSRTWQKSILTVQTEPRPDGKPGFVIKKKHIPKIVATLIKWPNAYGERVDAEGKTVAAAYCSGGPETMIPDKQTDDPNKVWTSHFYPVNGLPAGCGQPNGYLNLMRPNGVSANIGTDSNLIYLGWEYSAAIGLNGTPAATFSYTPSCVLRTSTPYVTFPAITVSQLKSGETIDRNFEVNLECDNTINPAVRTRSVSIGLQPSAAAFAHAKTLGLIDARTGGVTHLVSDDYGASGMAQGVGITLKNGDGDKVNFVSWDGCVPIIPDNGTPSYCPIYAELADHRASGWDPIMSGSTQVSSNTAMATTTYRKTYTATLGKIPNLEPTAGKIKATATILVRLP